MLTRLLKADHSGIEQAAQAMKNGALVAYPTDTVYGLGCDPFNTETVQRLITSKARTGGGLPLLVGSVEKALEIARMDNASLRLAERFWPGPLTLVVPAEILLPSHVTGPSNTVGLRVPNRWETLQLIKQFGGAIVGTSANLSGRAAAKSAKEVLETLAGRIDIVLDGGEASLGVESTVVRVEHGEIDVLREKAISSKEIFDTLGIEPVRVG